MSRALVIAEHDESVLAPATHPTITAALQLEVDAIDVAVLAANGDAVAREAASIRGVDRVLVLERAENHPYLAACWAQQITELSDTYTHFLAPASTFGKDLLPRVAGRLGVSALSDVTHVVAAHEFERRIYAGNAVVRVRADPGRIVCLTIRPSAFAGAATGCRAAIERIDPAIDLPVHTRFVNRTSGRTTGPDLQTAARVVAGGRGVGSATGFELVEQLAAALDAAVGASRAAVDAGWASNDLQVGQTGKIIAPELYVAVGISGAIQHQTGIRDAKTIVAINSDADAPLCAAADLVLVADLFAAVPELIASLRARRHERA